MSGKNSRPSSHSPLTLSPSKGERVEGERKVFQYPANAGTGSPVTRAERGRQLYEGKWKVLYEAAEPDHLILRFKDVPSFRRAGRPTRVPGRGSLKARITARLFAELMGQGIPTHFVKMLGERELLVRRLEMIRLEVVLRNVVAGSLAARLGMESGTPLSAPVLELYYKSDALGDPLVNESHVFALGLATGAELRTIRETALRANRALLPFFAEREILLADFKLEFGRHRATLMVGDELTPDGCRFWDRATQARLGKERSRMSPAQEAARYHEIYARICA
ncbi:MAG: phosphoribosylaminoimidazolesuccinocarboxamide synthase [candidate division NC10 bacterium]|nr:phosphoribosylaminoimidazolesuccinocarboxamide synthase [candidate division NC10 bacterium]